ncbi:hypothetical protein P3T27_008173 [Kitasatospora sp. MAA19]|nr:hypothetical protein [Kitasatospora sp. MAA19]
MAVSTTQPAEDDASEAPAEPPHGRSGEEAELELVAYAGGSACPEYGDGEVRYGAQALVPSSSPDGQGPGDGTDLATTSPAEFEAAPRTGWVPVSSDWMAGIPSSVNIRDMSIPGTHESAEPSPGTWTPEFHAARVILRDAAVCFSNWIGLR